jgi:hypothetical protein
MLEHMWGDPGYRLDDLGHDGLSEMVTADDRFAYEFTDYADSALPIQIFRLIGSALVDVTRSYPAQIRDDAAGYWQGYLQARNQQDADVRGILGAWAADEALLGTWASASTALNGALARGDLNRGPTLSGWPKGRAYLTALRSFLTKNGYL